MSAKLMDEIRNSNAPVEKESVFSRAINAFGIEGPDTCHRLWRKYDIVMATFIQFNNDLSTGMQQSRFVIADPQNADNTTEATLHDGSLLPKNIFPGDLLRMEVESSSLQMVKLQIPTDVDTGFISSAELVNLW